MAAIIAVAPAVPARALSGAVSVIDGDTIDVGDTRVRLHGIDAPELRQTCGPDGMACGAHTAAVLRDRYGGRVARCTPRDRDRHGRVVAVCRVAGADIGAALVEAGLAFAYRRYSHDYVAAEERAAAAGRGLHATTGVLRPEDWRRARAGTRLAQPDPPDGCRIKGNVSASGRIYHRPGQAFYDATSIDLARGERWFCSAAEARKAGWRASLR